MKKISFLFIISLVYSLAAFSQIREGQPAPGFELKDMQGGTAKLSDLRGKVVLLDFWASWCGPCRKNNPHLVKLYKKYHDKGLEILGISLDQDEEAWKKAINHDGLSWTQVVDGRQSQDNIANTYGVSVIPTSFLLDKEGRIKLIDPQGWALESEIKSLLKN